MNRSNRWVWKVIQGIIALVIGLFVMLGGEVANTTLAWFFSIYLFVSGALQLWRGLINRQAAGGSVDLTMGIIGVVGGGIVLFLLWQNESSTPLLYTLLGVLFILYGTVGLFETLFARGSALFSWGELLINILLLGLGIMIFVSRSQGFDLRFWGGLVLAIIGLAIAGYAYFFQRSGAPQVAAPAPPPKKDNTPSV